MLLAAQPAPHCGSDRWAVKTLTDLDRAHVSMEPVSTTIAALAAIPIQELRPYRAAAE